MIKEIQQQFNLTLIFVISDIYTYRVNLQRRDGVAPDFTECRYIFELRGLKV